MDRDEFRLILRNSGVDVWDLIETAISVAYSDYGDELRKRRDGIMQMMYKKSSLDEEKGREKEKSINASEIVDEIEEEWKILDIKDDLEDPNQPQESIVHLLQTLAEMKITFEALKDTGIGRQVNQLRKHPSNDVRRLAKHLVSKWKDLTDEWLKLNPTMEFTAEGYSPPQKIARTGHHRMKDPNPGAGLEKNSAEPEPKVKVVLPTGRAQSVPVPASLPPNTHKDTTIDPQKFASTRKRLLERYKEAESVKKQRTIRVVDIHDIPKPKRSFFAKPKAG